MKKEITPTLSEIFLTPTLVVNGCSLISCTVGNFNGKSNLLCCYRHLASHCVPENFATPITSMSILVQKP